jgi:serine/threonine protein kinase
MLSDWGHAYELPNGMLKTRDIKRGTSGYRAPEIEELRYCDVTSDWWSLGKLIKRFCCVPIAAEEMSPLQKQIDTFVAAAFPWIESGLLQREPERRKLPSFMDFAHNTDQDLVDRFCSICFAVIEISKGVSGNTIPDYTRLKREHDILNAANPKDPVCVEDLFSTEQECASLPLSYFAVFPLVLNHILQLRLSQMDSFPHRCVPLTMAQLVFLPFLQACRLPILMTFLKSSQAGSLQPSVLGSPLRSLPLHPDSLLPRLLSVIPHSPALLLVSLSAFPLHLVPLLPLLP